MFQHNERRKALPPHSKLWGFRATKTMKNGSINEMVAEIPDEFRDKFTNWRMTIANEVARVVSTVEHYYERAPKDGTQKEFALWVMQHCKPLSSYMFERHKDGDIVPMIYQKHDWKSVEKD